MANNRLYLGCKYCMAHRQPEKDEALAQPKLYIAKYYPSEGWYTPIEDGYWDQMEKFLQLHTHYIDNGEWWEIGYE